MGISMGLHDSFLAVGCGRQSCSVRTTRLDRTLRRYNFFFLLDHRWSTHVQVQGTSAFVSSDFEHCMSDQLALTVSPSFPAKRHGSKQASSFRIPEFLLQHHIITRLQPTESYDRCRYDLVKDTLMCFNTVVDVDLVCSAVWKSLVRRAPS